ncbi:MULTISPECIES: DUF1016 N-terminal domain-containing protein [unclassified Mesorhizobium]|uniref:DUF1016 N-terminal domain-containing protein n=1 Tax=unclassified Mesorhizobium TaxID=325217 RepID=UPI001FDF0FFA|nr:MULTISPECIES: DUF1016 N-terminal domain-containing protein [unclassified Mesorhizobium]
MSPPPSKPAPRRAKTDKAAVEIDAQSYAAFVGDLKQKIAAARHRAGLSVNRELILLYWNIGRDILGRQEREGWGAKVIDRLAGDLGRAFPEMTGLSARNLKYMRAFAEVWPDGEFVQQVVALLPWGHNVRLLDAIKAPKERAWYARQAIEHGWSRNVLAHQIDSNLFARQGDQAKAKAMAAYGRLIDAHMLATGVLASGLLRINGAVVEGDQTAFERDALFAAFVIGLEPCERAIAEARYLQAHAMLRQELEILAQLKAVRANRRKLNGAPNVAALEQSLARL